MPEKFGKCEKFPEFVRSFILSNENFNELPGERRRGALFLRAMRGRTAAPPARLTATPGARAA